jgi:hypothetical protein
MEQHPMGATTMLDYFEKKWDLEVMRLEEVYPSVEWTDELREMLRYALELGQDHALDTIRDGALLMPEVKKKTLTQEIPKLQLVDTASAYWGWGDASVEVTLKKEESELGDANKQPIKAYTLTIKGDTVIIDPACVIADEICDAWFDHTLSYAASPSNEDGDEGIIVITSFNEMDRHGDFPDSDMPVLLDDIFFGLKKKLERANDA